jgi:nucleoid-associated protein YgaU
MESDTIESSSESKLPLIAGIAGIALGVVALILAVKAKGAADNAATAAAEARQNAADAAALVGTKADGAAVSALAADLSALNERTAKGFTQASEAYAALQKAVEGGRGRSTGGSTGGATAVAGPGEYIVVKGDTLSGIARKVGVSLKGLQDLNPGVGNALRIGQKLKVK